MFDFTHAVLSLCQDLLHLPLCLNFGLLRLRLRRADLLTDYLSFFFQLLDSALKMLGLRPQQLLLEFGLRSGSVDDVEDAAPLSISHR
ncbi:hypothetical protein OCOJLMKI_4543 [Methylobacterium iners]|uniref:Uncharacterized protein n=1 Tax=Methylobacterium iners TaxID=418707 RepID=A0ABQ4S2L2_9HYPH|nr:hypothetical protein OCOJLMKI_4543 [Methylobacterium iners]